MNAKNIFKTTHFRRTLELLDTLRVLAEKLKGFPNERHPKQITDWFLHINIENVFKSILSEKEYHMLYEIYSIEKEKLLLKTGIEDLTPILSKESELLKEREKMLNSSLKELMGSSLMIGPFINTYESYWEWIVRESALDKFKMEELIDQEPATYYFGFEKCGTYDVITDTNVFEFSLTEFQYILLRLFEEENSVSKVLERFYEIFEVESEQERNELYMRTEKMLRLLIYRRLLVRCR
jgi:hypothetical protein